MKDLKGATRMDDAKNDKGGGEDRGRKKKVNWSQVKVKSTLRKFE